MLALFGSGRLYASNFDRNLPACPRACFNPFAWRFLFALGAWWALSPIAHPGAIAIIDAKRSASRHPAALAVLDQAAAGRFASARPNVVE
jgi:hypothetical protein